MSTIRPDPIACPARPVPAPRAIRGTRNSAAISITAWSASSWRGRTTPNGSTWWLEASVLYSTLSYGVEANLAIHPAGERVLELGLQ